MRYSRRDPVHQPKAAVTDKRSDNIGNKVVYIRYSVQSEQLNNFNRKRQPAADQKNIFYAPVMPAYKGAQKARRNKKENI